MILFGTVGVGGGVFLSVADCVARGSSPWEDSLCMGRITGVTLDDPITRPLLNGGRVECFFCVELEKQSPYQKTCLRYAACRTASTSYQTVNLLT